MIAGDGYIKLADFVKLEKIGEGKFAKVFKIIHKQTGIIYAAKISFHEHLHNSNTDDINLKREVEILSKINHASILKFIGYSPTNFKSKPNPVIVTEYVQNNSLFKMLQLERQNKAPKAWNSTKKFICIYGIAAGLSHLHSRRILHRDLKAMNILLDDNLYPKISDFGLSKILHNNASSYSIQSTDGLKGTPNYMSPEIFTNFHYSNSSDIYAYGMIVYEIVTLRIPFEKLHHIEIMRKVINNERPEIPSNVSPEYRELIEKCWSQNPSDRPRFLHIFDKLFKLSQDGIDRNEYDKYLKYLHEHANNDIHSIDTSENKTVSSRFLDLFSVKSKKVNFFPSEIFESLDEDFQQLIHSASIDSNSQFKLGKKMISSRLEIPNRAEIGIKYLEESISHDNLDSVVYYCELLIEGENILKDLGKAKRYLSKYENSNDSRIYFLHGKILLMQNDYSESKKYFLKSTKLGNNLASFEYGKMLLEENIPEGLDYIRNSRTVGSTKYVSLYEHMMLFEGFEQLPIEMQHVFIMRLIEGKPIYDDIKDSVLSFDQNVLQIIYKFNLVESDDFIKVLNIFQKIEFKLIYPSKLFDQLFNTLQKIKNFYKRIFTVTLIIENTKTLSYKFGKNNFVGYILINPPTKHIKESVFSNFENLFSVTFPETLKTIGEHAFEGCHYFISLNIPKSVRQIGITSFFGCEKLFDVQLSSNVIELFYNYGLNLYKQGEKEPTNYIESFRFFKRCAILGHKESIFYCSRMVENGLGIYSTESDVFECISMAASAGFVESIYKYGLFHIEGKYLFIANVKEGWNKIKTAADNGYVIAMIKYGKHLEENERRIVQEDEAIKYFKMAANKGNDEGMINYGRLLIKSKKSSDYKEAIKYFKDLANKGNIKGILHYSFMLDNGLGIQVDHSKANEYYKFIIENGNIKYIYKLAHDLEAGVKYNKNIEESIRYYKLCADNGYVKGMYKYALFLYNGQYIQQNKEESIRYFEMASAQGDLNSTKMLEQINNT